jgi:hypothetical protein
MSQIHQDPVSYLNEAINNRGKSTRNGVYLTNITVVAEATVDYGYKELPPRPDPSGVWQLHPYFDELDWLRLLVSLRSQVVENPESLDRQDCICQFIPEGPKMSMNVFIPKTCAEGFAWEVSFHQELLKWVCDFAGKVPTFIRFNIGFAERSWDDMVKTQDAQEMDLNF